MQGAPFAPQFKRLSFSNFQSRNSEQIEISLRLACILFVSTAAHIHFVIEQPEGSKDVLFHHPRLDYWSNCVGLVSWLRPMYMGINDRNQHSLGLLCISTCLLGLPYIFLDDAPWSEMCKTHGGMVKCSLLDPWACQGLSIMRRRLIVQQYSKLRKPIVCNILGAMFQQCKDLGKLPKHEKDSKTEIKTTRGTLRCLFKHTLAMIRPNFILSASLAIPGKTKSANGKKSFTGTPRLKETACGTQYLWFRLWSYPVCFYLRAYPLDFGKALEKLLWEQKPVPDLRGKLELPAGLSDRELFEQTPTGDLWWDASLPFVWEYLYKNRKCVIPTSWEETMSRFNAEVMSVT